MVMICCCVVLPSVLWCCWLVGRKGIQPVKTEWWGTGMIICLERSATLFACGPADATATPSFLATVKSRVVYLSGAGLHRLFWKKGCWSRCSSSSVLLCGVVCKLKLKREQRKANVAEPSAANSQGANSAVLSNGTVSSCTLIESRKRKRTTDEYHDDDNMQGKKLKFSSLFTNNPEIPHVDR